MRFSTEPASWNNMRRILLSSLLSVFVLGQQYNNSSYAREEVDYYEYEDEPSDNCSLATPLYYPIRRTESFFKGIRGEIIEGANSEANHIEYRIERWTENDRDFRFWSSFRYPVEAEFGYREAINSGSQVYLSYTDIFHSYISWGEFSDTEDFTGWRYRYSLNSIAKTEKMLDEFVSNLSEERNRYQKLMKNLVRLIKPDTWPFLASCLYEAFKENQDSSRLSQAVTDLVSEDELEMFNRYFKRYVGDISKSLKKVLESEYTLEMVQLAYELTKSEIRAIDYNHLQSTLYYFVLQLKTVLMKPDIKELWTTLNQTDYFVQESLWKLNTGRWPEMATFVDNFLRRTVGSIVFWDRLTGPFIPEMKNEALQIVDDFKYELPDINLDTFFKTLTSIIFMIADGDEASIRQIFKDIRGSKWDETLASYIEIIADELTSCNLATLASYLPSYDDIKSTINNRNPWLLQPIKTLLFKDWPQDEIYPASIEDFVRGLYYTRHAIFHAIFGRRPCDNDTN